MFGDVTLKTMLHDLLSADPAHAEALERHGRAVSRSDPQDLVHGSLQGRFIPRGIS